MVWGDAAGVVMVSPNENDPTKVEPLRLDFKGCCVTVRVASGRALGLI
jgi:hypothetical protein